MAIMPAHLLGHTYAKHWDMRPYSPCLLTVDHRTPARVPSPACTLCTQ